MNTLYYGDNLDILRRYVKDEMVDLVYLDPPFKSNQDYNILFAEQDGTRAAAQIKAFGDTWRWDESAARSYQEIVEQGGKVSDALQAFRKFLGDNDMLRLRKPSRQASAFRRRYGRVAACHEPLDGRDSGFGVRLHLPKVRQNVIVIRGHNSILSGLTGKPIQCTLLSGNRWWPRRDSDPQLPDSKSGALPH